MGAEKHRILELDGLRCIAIMSVIVFHAFNAPLLWSGVDIFFVLSGFLITGILMRRKESGVSYYSYFYSRRARRILPPYVLLLTVSSVLISAAWMKYWYWYAFFASNVASALNQAGEELGPLWSLAVEEQFYLVWPLVVMMASRRALLRISIIVFVAAPLLRAIATPWFATNTPIYCLTPFRMDLLASGAIIAWVYRWNPGLLYRSRVWVHVTWVGAACLVVALALIDPGFRTAANTVRSNVFVYLLTNGFATSFVIIAVNGYGIVCRILRNSVLRYIGQISYSMYLIHAVALILAGKMFPSHRFGAGLALTIAYATVCWFGFERRLLAAPAPAKLSVVTT